MLDYKELLFRELRMVSVDPVNDISDEAITKAVTLNENLKAMGYCITPDSFPVLCKSDLGNLYETLKGYIGEVKALPMYPGFPDEVMAMDEATFRFHQILHYMSTYGVELFSGTPVSKGWLPESNAKERTKSDTFTTDLKQIEIISVEEAYHTPAKIILSRKMRLTNSQEELIKEAVLHLSSVQMEDLVIPFKENVQALFDLGVGEKSLPILKLACKNPMDAFKCTREYLSQKGWHLKTSEKRIIAKLWDSFDNASFEENLIYSNQRREMIIRVIDYIDYTTYARNLAHVVSVNDLKDKKLRSWMSGVEKRIKEGNEAQLFAMLKQRPGMLIRMAIRMISLGYAKSVKEVLTSPEVASKLSTQTIIDLLNVDLDFKEKVNKWDTEKVYEWDVLKKILCQTLSVKLSSIETPLKGKKVFFDAQDYDVDHSMIMKSDEGGYNRGGLAFRIPESVNKMRFFVYWNDSRRVDVDLHAMIQCENSPVQHVGWNGHFKNNGVVTSGDITHSDAAEYIDIDMNQTTVDVVSANINIYAGRSSFCDIEECFTGLMAIEDLNQEVKLYDPKACFISHKMTSKASTIKYGIINVKERFVRYLGVGDESYYDERIPSQTPYSLKEYLDVLFEVQGVTLVDSKEDADCVVGMAKGADLSLIDENFFLDL